MFKRKSWQVVNDPLVVSTRAHRRCDRPRRCLLYFKHDEKNSTPRYKPHVRVWTCTCLRTNHNVGRSPGPARRAHGTTHAFAGPTCFSNDHDLYRVHRAVLLHPHAQFHRSLRPLCARILRGADIRPCTAYRHLHDVISIGARGHRCSKCDRFWRWVGSTKPTLRLVINRRVFRCANDNSAHLRFGRCIHCKDRS